MLSKVFGIDLGTSTLKIYKKGEGVVVDEKNVIAIENRQKVMAIGNEAYEMLEKAPINIKVTYPVRNGVIADIANMEALLDAMVKKHLKMKGGTCLIAVPTDITEVEKRAFFDLVANSRAKLKEVGIVEKPIAAALGAGLDITVANGVMVVDIGADTTEISVMSLGGIVLSKLIPIGGNKLDESIKNYVKKKYNLLIGDKTAEILKKALANAYDMEQEGVKVYGRNVVTGLPSEMEISAEMVHESIQEYLIAIVDSIKQILERTPPEISSDIIDNGIYVAGGSAGIRNIDRLISDHTELNVNIVNDPSNAVVNGLGMIMEDSNLHSLATMIKSSSSIKKRI
ncbi:rod shape-determining protein MreB [Lachnospiraceae bacterium KM106-2]|nr:rod shape-determining protein MreB [Lachnospiraceae bacterium KM106-2]